MIENATTRHLDAARWLRVWISILLFVVSPALVAGQSAQTTTRALQEDIANGSAALARGDNGAAEKSFREALSLDPNSVPLRDNLALALARQNRTEEAIALYRQALALKPGDGVTERNIGVAYYRAHQFANARPFLERSAATTHTFQSLELAGLDLFALDLYAEAIPYLQQARTLQPEDLNNLSILGQAYLRAKQYTPMIEIFSHIMALHPDSAEAHVMLATAYDKLFREGEAIRELVAAEQADPLYPGVHTDLGVIYWRTDDPARARQEFMLALQQNPADPVANCTMGRILRQEGKLSEAISHFEAALAVNPVYKDALRETGQSWIELHDPAKAIGFLRRAITVDPGDAGTHYILGTALLETGESPEGKRERAEAARLLAKQHATTSPVSANTQSAPR